MFLHDGVGHGAGRRRGEGQRGKGGKGAAAVQRFSGSKVQRFKGSAVQRLGVGTTITTEGHRGSRRRTGYPENEGPGKTAGRLRVLPASHGLPSGSISVPSVVKWHLGFAAGPGRARWLGGARVQRFRSSAVQRLGGGEDHHHRGPLRFTEGQSPETIGRRKAQAACTFLRPTWVSLWFYLCALRALCGEIVFRFFRRRAWTCSGRRSWHSQTIRTFQPCGSWGRWRLCTPYAGARSRRG